MKSFFVAVLCVLMCVSAWAASRKTYPMNVPATGVRTIRFDVQEGDFVLRGDPMAKQVEMHVSVDRYWLFKLGEEGILNKLIKVSGEGTPELIIKTNIEPSWKNWGRAEYPIDFEVVVPQSSAIRIQDTSGKIVISHIDAPVEIDDGSGTLTVREVHGPLGVRKQSGDILVDSVTGPTIISSHSGQMKLQEVGELTIEDSDGNLVVAGATSAQIHSRGGNVQVSDISGKLELNNDSGEIVLSGIAGATTLTDTSGGIRASRMGPMTIRDTSGDINVDGAVSVNVVAKESGQVKVKNVSGAVDVPRGITLKRE